MHNNPHHVNQMALDFDNTVTPQVILLLILIIRLVWERMNGVT